MPMTANPALDTQETRPIKPPLPMQKMAWVIMIGAFLLFCSSSVALTGGLYYFLLHSDLPMNVVAQAGRGTTVIIDKNFNESSITGDHSTRWQMALNDRPTIIRTGTLDQALLAFKRPDDDFGDVTAATITLDNSSRIQLERADRPRFDWSQSHYALELTEASGRFEIFIHNNIEQPFRMQISVARGHTALFDKPGRYTLEVNEGQMRLTAREGSAILVTPERENNRLVTSGQAVVMITGRNQPASPGPRVNLLENGLFAFDIPAVPQGESATDHSDTGDNALIMPAYWGCSRVQNTPPGSRFTADIQEGRAAWRLIRSDATSHGETSCRQEFPGEFGIDIREYTYLEVKSTFLIAHQSLSQCGEQGSECPMMIRVDYYDQYATEPEKDVRSWYSGFYYNVEPQYESWPPRCNSCLQDHRRINNEVWYTFNSGNLITSLPTTPAAIKRVVFYASGHEYDVFVSEIALMAGASEVVPPDVPLSNTPVEPDTGSGSTPESTEG